MELFRDFIFYFIIISGILNLIRIFVYVIASLQFNLWQVSPENRLNKVNIKNRNQFPEVLVIVPAYNEAKTIKRTIESLNLVNYPKAKLKIVIVNDGSKDGTGKKVKSILKHKKWISNFDFKLINKPNGGKADALNTGIKSTEFGELITCLDADSTVDANFFINMVKYFKFKSVFCAAANVKLNHANSILGFLQMFEYLISYQMKKAQTYLNVEYIVGGIGSTFRRSVVEQVGYYDTNTVTEDIDLTMKLINKIGNKRGGIIYAPDAIAYSQPVLKFKELVAQRFRWKFGRFQTLYKNRRVIFSRSKKHSKLLSWLMIPWALFGEATLGLEFLIFLNIILYSIIVSGPAGLVYPIILSIWYAWYNIWYSEAVDRKQKLLLYLASPLMYFGMGLMMFVEVIAMLKCLIKLPAIKKSVSKDMVSWVSPSRH